MHRFKMPRDRAYNDDVEEKKNLLNALLQRKKLLAADSTLFYSALFCLTAIQASKKTCWV